MNKHTQGQWRCDASKIRTSIEANGIHIAMVSWGNIPQEEHFANARLIAAAPELLDLVEEALILIEGRPEHACERFEAKAKEMIERVKKN